MNLLLRLIFACFMTLAIIGILFVIGLFQVILPTGEVVLITDRIILAALITFVLLLLIFYFAKKEEKKVKVPMEELEAMIYIIEDIDKSKMKEESKAGYLIKRTLPYLGLIITEYKEFLHSLPAEDRKVFYKVYSSLKHPHYYFKRKIQDALDLKDIVSEILKKYKA